ncbi:hypothetical protein T492DRAFT_1131967 [Pavlovales sp. CCMP2436]|nr:hypothetical protein T492DRAFT_1131967 [Pavlovales sp. CCMP2436]
MRGKSDAGAPAVAALVERVGGAQACNERLLQAVSKLLLAVSRAQPPAGADVLAQAEVSFKCSRELDSVWMPQLLKSANECRRSLAGRSPAPSPSVTQVTENAGLRVQLADALAETEWLRTHLAQLDELSTRSQQSQALRAGSGSGWQAVSGGALDGALERAHSCASLLIEEQMAAAQAVQAGQLDALERTAGASLERARQLHAVWLPELTAALRQAGELPVGRADGQPGVGGALAGLGRSSEQLVRELRNVQALLDARASLRELSDQLGLTLNLAREISAAWLPRLRASAGGGVGGGEGGDERSLVVAEAALHHARLERGTLEERCRALLERAQQAEAAAAASVARETAGAGDGVLSELAAELRAERARATGAYERAVAAEADWARERAALSERAAAADSRAGSLEWALGEAEAERRTAARMRAVHPPPPTEGEAATELALKRQAHLHDEALATIWSEQVRPAELRERAARDEAAAAEIATRAVELRLETSRDELERCKEAAHERERELRAQLGKAAGAGVEAEAEATRESRGQLREAEGAAAAAAEEAARAQAELIAETRARRDLERVATAAERELSALRTELAALHARLLHAELGAAEAREEARVEVAAAVRATERVVHVTPRSDPAAAAAAAAKASVAETAVEVLREQLDDERSLAAQIRARLDAAEVALVRERADRRGSSASAPSHGPLRVRRSSGALSPTSADEAVEEEPLSPRAFSARVFGQPRREGVRLLDELTVLENSLAALVGYERPAGGGARVLAGGYAGGGALVAGAKLDDGTRHQDHRELAAALATAETELGRLRAQLQQAQAARDGAIASERDALAAAGRAARLADAAVAKRDAAERQASALTRDAAEEVEAAVENALARARAEAEEGLLRAEEGHLLELDVQFAQLEARAAEDEAAGARARAALGAETDVALADAQEARGYAERLRGALASAEVQLRELGVDQAARAQLDGGLEGGALTQVIDAAAARLDEIALRALEPVAAALSETAERAAQLEARAGAAAEVAEAAAEVWAFFARIAVHALLAEQWLVASLVGELGGGGGGGGGLGGGFGFGGTPALPSRHSAAAPVVISDARAAALAALSVTTPAALARSLGASDLEASLRASPPGPRSPVQPGASRGLDAAGPSLEVAVQQLHADRKLCHWYIEQLQARADAGALGGAGGSPAVPAAVLSRALGEATPPSARTLALAATVISTEQLGALGAHAALQRHVLGAYASLLDAAAGAAGRERSAASLRASWGGDVRGSPFEPLRARVEREAAFAAAAADGGPAARGGAASWRAPPPPLLPPPPLRVGASAQTEPLLQRSRATQAEGAAPLADAATDPGGGVLVERGCDAAGDGLRSWAFVRYASVGTESTEARSRNRGVQATARGLDVGSSVAPRVADAATESGSVAQRSTSTLTDMIPAVAVPAFAPTPTPAPTPAPAPAVRRTASPPPSTRGEFGGARHDAMPGVGGAQAPWPSPPHPSRASAASLAEGALHAAGAASEARDAALNARAGGLGAPGGPCAGLATIAAVAYPEPRRAQTPVRSTESAAGIAVELARTRAALEHALGEAVKARAFAEEAIARARDADGWLAAAARAQNARARAERSALSSELAAAEAEAEVSRGLVRALSAELKDGVGLGGGGSFGALADAVELVTARAAAAEAGARALELQLAAARRALDDARLAPPPVGAALATRSVCGGGGALTLGAVDALQQLLLAALQLPAFSSVAAAEFEFEGGGSTPPLDALELELESLAAEAATVEAAVVGLRAQLDGRRRASSAIAAAAAMGLGGAGGMSVGSGASAVVSEAELTALRASLTDALTRRSLVGAHAARVDAELRVADARERSTQLAAEARALREHVRRATEVLAAGGRPEESAPPLPDEGALAAAAVVRTTAATTPATTGRLYGGTSGAGGGGGGCLSTPTSGCASEPWGAAAQVLGPGWALAAEPSTAALARAQMQRSPPRGVGVAGGVGEAPQLSGVAEPLRRRTTPGARSPLSSPVSYEKYLQVLKPSSALRGGSVSRGGGGRQSSGPAERGGPHSTAPAARPPRARASWRPS